MCSFSVWWHLFNLSFFSFYMFYKSCLENHKTANLWIGFFCVYTEARLNFGSAFCEEAVVV